MPSVAEISQLPRSRQCVSIFKECKNHLGPLLKSRSSGPALLQFWFNRSRWHLEISILKNDPGSPFMKYWFGGSVRLLDNVTSSLWMAEEVRWVGDRLFNDRQRGTRTQEVPDRAVHLHILLLLFHSVATLFSFKRNFFKGSLMRKLYYIQIS